MLQLDWVGKPVVRIDGCEKVSGLARYAGDIYYENMLWGKVVRSKYPHAIIRNIDISRAIKHPAVSAVLTYRDIKGTNRFGSIIPDQEVLSSRKARCIGDPVALIAAETREVASEAAALIQIDYEPLAPVTDPVKALDEEAPKIHDSGNVLRHEKISKGDIDEGLRDAAVRVKNTYYVRGRQSPCYLEPEAGVGLVDGEGNIVLYVSTQSPFEDQFQIGSALGIPKEKIRVVATPVGGGFGGKCDITVQAHLAVLAMNTGRPTKLVWSREESMIVGYKRHPMTITMETGAQKDGRLTANRVKVIADTGAYASYGGVVLTVGLENSCGPYRIPNVAIEGYAVYTNNSIAGAINGFAIPQLSFAMESQMDILAGELEIDPIELRRINSLNEGDIGPSGYPVIRSTIGFKNTLSEIEQCSLWMRRASLKEERSAPWKKRGVGVACAVKGCGFQNVVRDVGTVSVEMERGGRFMVGVSCPDIGQGNMTAYAQIAAESLRLRNLEEVSLQQPDTFKTPNTGQTVASKSLYLGGNAITLAAEKLKAILVDEASKMLETSPSDLECADSSVRSRTHYKKSVSYKKLAERIISRDGKTRVEATYQWPRFGEADLKNVDQKVADMSHVIYDYTSTAAMVEVDTLTGAVQVLRVVPVVDAGRVINPLGFEGQQEGCVVMGLGFALMEDTIMENGIVKTPNLTSYVVPSSLDSPEIETISAEFSEPGGPFGAKGAGESGITCVAAAIANAVYDATGVRMLTLPLTPDEVFRALHEKGLQHQNFN